MDKFSNDKIAADAMNEFAVDFRQFCLAIGLRTTDMNSGKILQCRKCKHYKDPKKTGICENLHFIQDSKGKIRKRCCRMWSNKSNVQTGKL